MKAPEDGDRIGNKPPLKTDNQSHRNRKTASALKVASGAAQDREFEVAADETWGLLVGSAAVPLPLHLY